MKNPTRYVQHYKGGVYEVLHAATDSTDGRNTHGEPMIVYRSCDTGAIRVRTSEQFYQPVTWPDGGTRTRFCPLVLSDPGTWPEEGGSK